MDTYFKHLKKRDWTSLTEEEKLELITQIRFKRRQIMAPVIKPTKTKKAVTAKKKVAKITSSDFDAYILDLLLQGKVLISTDSKK